jgi:hypothetical protein
MFRLVMADGKRGKQAEGIMEEDLRCPSVHISGMG